VFSFQKVASGYLLIFVTAIIVMEPSLMMSVVNLTKELTSKAMFYKYRMKHFYTLLDVLAVSHFV